MKRGIARLMALSLHSSLSQQSRGIMPEGAKLPVAVENPSPSIFEYSHPPRKERAIGLRLKLITITASLRSITGPLHTSDLSRRRRSIADLLSVCCVISVIQASGHASLISKVTPCDSLPVARRVSNCCQHYGTGCCGIRSTTPMVTTHHPLAKAKSAWLAMEISLRRPG